jgi:predicted DNA-binding transcriptional regulator YafY
MTRTERLLALLQILRRHRYPVTGTALASELGISLRSLYRDIATLQAQGADIEGEAGLGYVLRPGFTLPPLMFSQEEIEAIVLGSRWVAKRADDALGLAAQNALAKIAAVLPQDLRAQIETSALFVVPGEPVMVGEVELKMIRRAIRMQHKIDIEYADVNGEPSRRMIWPFALAFFERVRIVVAWCELRQDFRHFRTDRITKLVCSETRYPRHRQVLFAEWRERECIPPQ